MTHCTKLQIESLVGLAVRDFEAKLTEENVITETFSRFASQYVPNHIQTIHLVMNPNGCRQSEIMVMGWKDLDGMLKARKINESVRGIIHGMAGGDAAHQTDALKFGLYGALRQKGSTSHPFAQLRCPNTACNVHPQLVSYLSLGNSTGCTSRGWFGRAGTTKPMVCSECSHPRTDHCSWCKGCRRMFR